MKNLLILFSLLLAFTGTKAQETKQRIYAEIGIGAGQTLFFGDTKSNIGSALGGTFEPGIAGNLIMAFYYAPENWKGFGIGSRIKGTGSGPAYGDFDNSYFFNFYNLAISSKYYLKGNFNKGLYARAGLGFGQLTTKRADEVSNSFVHQFAIGSTITGSIGYSFFLSKSAIAVEMEFESSSRGGTVNNVGDVTFRSGQAALNLIYSF